MAAHIIYGFGGVLILVLLRRWADRPLLLFFQIIALCAVLEYGTSWVLERFAGARWWDYTGYLFNLHGRISLEGLLAFGLGGFASIYFLAPMLDDFYYRMRGKIKPILCVLLILAFAVDFSQSLIHPNQGEGPVDAHAAVHQTDNSRDVFKALSI